MHIFLTKYVILGVHRILREIVLVVEWYN